MQEEPTNETAILNEKDDKKIIRCQSCGHFLMEMICTKGYFKILCRQSDCKNYNHINVNGGQINYELEKKKDMVRM